MRVLLTLTHILTMVFIGLIIGGIIAGERATWVAGIILLVADIVLGLILQYVYENSWYK